MLHERLELGAAGGICAAAGRATPLRAFGQVRERGGEAAGVAIGGVEVEQRLAFVRSVFTATACRESLKK